MAGTILKAGDIAIIGFNFDDPDQFSFLALTDLSVGTTINFSDNGWLSSGGFRSTEGVFTWTATQDLKAGAVINVSNSGLAFATAGDQIIAYQGTAQTPTLIYALNSEGVGIWQPNAIDSNTSALPTGLENGKTAIALSEIDNAIYTGPTSGTATELRTAISNSANWSGSDTVRQTLPTTSFNVVTGTTPVVPPTPTTITPIYTIQGASHTSPLAGKSVTTQGVVTALTSKGFYLQGASDGKVATSDGILIYTGTTPTVKVGDSLQVQGLVTEFKPGGATSGNLTTTEITNPTITSLSTPLSPINARVIGNGGRKIPTQIIDNDSFATFKPTIDGIDFYESLEGMLVKVNNGVAVSPTSDFGEIWMLADNGVNATGRNSRGGITISDGGTTNPLDDFNPERIQIDDTLFGIAPQVNVGDKLGSVTGVIDYSFGNYELLPTVAPTVTSGGLTRETTNLVGTANQLAVASYNVENLDPSDGIRFNTIAAQIVNNLKSPDIIALQEIQDNNGATNDAVVDASLTYQTLINAINAAGGPQYQFRDVAPVDDGSGGQPGGNIRVGYLFRTDRVNVVDNSIKALGLGDPAFDASRNPLYTQFNFQGQTIDIINNHFTSKGGSTSLFGDTQPYVNGGEDKRNAQAQIVNDFVKSLQQTNPNANVVVLGDFNEFQFETPMQTLAGTNLTNLTDTLAPNERYSYNFEGNSQKIDHILVSNNLVAKAESDSVHINSEFADQVSDHDPSVARFTFTQPVASNLTMEYFSSSSLSADPLLNTSASGGVVA